MYYYVVCRFLKNLHLGENPYTYEVKKELFDKLKIGYHYKIRNKSGYTYQGAFVEVTGLFACPTKKRVEGTKLVENDSPSKYNKIEIKELVVMEEAGKYEHADEVIPIITANPYDCRYPIIVGGVKYTSARDAYNDNKWIMSIPKINTVLNIDDTVNKITSNGTITFTTDGIAFSKGNFDIYNLDENDKKEKKTMSKIFGNVEFGKYTGREIKMSVNGLAYLADNGKYVAYDKNKLTLTDVTDFVFDMDGLLYLFPVAIKDIKIGDIIKHGNSYVIVKDIAGGNFLEVIEPCSNEVKKVMPLRNIFGFDFYTKVVSLMGEGAFGTIDESNPFGNMLPFFLMMDNKEKEGFDAKTFMLMTALNGGAMDFKNNPYLMMMMLDNKGDMGDLLPLMLIANNGFDFGKKDCDCDCKGAYV